MLKEALWIKPNFILNLLVSCSLFACICVYVCVKKEMELSRAKKAATGSFAVQDQAPQQCWSIRSALQPDR